MTILIVLGLFALAFGMRALRGLAILGFLGFGAVLAYGVHDILTPRVFVQPTAVLASQCPPGNGLGPKPLPPFGRNDTVDHCPSSGFAAEPGHGPSRAFIEDDPQPVAKASAGPARSWQAIPWPPAAPETQAASPAAQRLLDRLNGWVR